MSGRIDKFQFCPNCFASQDSIAELPSSDNDFICTACDQELFYDVPYTECYEQEITKLKKALEIANNALSHIETHGRTDRGHYAIKYASEAQKQIKEVLEG